MTEQGACYGNLVPHLHWHVIPRFAGDPHFPNPVWGAKQSPPLPEGKPDVAKLARGEAIARTRHCARCHEPDYSGHHNVPRLAHQREDYLLKALRDYRVGRRIGYGNAAMAETVAGLADEDLAALAHLLAYRPYTSSR